MKRDFLSINDLSPTEIHQIIQRAKTLKEHPTNLSLNGKTIALLFEKPSLRTKVSFQVGIHQLNGYSLYLSPDEVGLGSREPVSDVAKVLSGYVDCIIARVFSHQTLLDLAKYASVPIINALSDHEHPCQTIADILTISEHKPDLQGLKLAFIGDGNNVSRSLCLGLPGLGISFSIATPKGYKLDPSTIHEASIQASSPQVIIESVLSPEDAVINADIVYTDVWASMGQEEESNNRKNDFQGYTVGPKLISQADSDALFMHDMPAHYGEEVEYGMLDHPQSVAYQQAHNRLHAQKALLEFLLC